MCKLLQELKEKILGIDFGDFTIGLAVFDENVDFVYPLKTIHRAKSNILRKSIREIIDIICKEKITKVIIGYPLNYDGSEGERVEKTKIFAKMLTNKLDALEEETKIRISVDFHDERLTTKEAKNILKEHGVEENYKSIVDQVAAEVILKDYVNSRRKIWVKWKIIS